jgi:hypothetical protein
MSNTTASRDAETVVAQAICVERFKVRQLTGEPTDADVDQVRHLAKAAIQAMKDLRTVSTAADVPIRAVAYNQADGSIVARFDQDHGVVFGDDRPFPWQDKYLRGPLTLLWHPDDGPSA